MIQKMLSAQFQVYWNRTKETCLFKVRNGKNNKLFYGLLKNTIIASINYNARICHVLFVLWSMLQISHKKENALKMFFLQNLNLGQNRIQGVLGVRRLKVFGPRWCTVLNLPPNPWDTQNKHHCINLELWGFWDFNISVFRGTLCFFGPKTAYSEDLL